MKKISYAILLILFTSKALLAQTFNEMDVNVIANFDLSKAEVSNLSKYNYSIKDDSLTWQMIYPTNLTIFSIVNSFYNDTTITITHYTSDRIEGYARRHKINYEDYGYTDDQLPSFIRRYGMDLKFRIEIRNGLYLVTVNDIYVYATDKDKIKKPNESSPKDGKTIKQIVLKDIICKNNNLHNGYYSSNIASLINDHLFYTFTAKTDISI